MIINEATRTLFMEVPKTGSTTIRAAYRGTPEGAKYNPTWTHIKLSELPNVFSQLHPDLALEDFTMYAFYRDPVERMVSGWRYSVSQWERARTSEEANRRLAYVRAAAVFHLMWNVDFDENVRPSLNGVSLDQFIDALESRASFPTSDLLTPQINYMNENTVLLNQANYDAEYQRIAPLLGLPEVLAAHTSRLNASDASDYLLSITSAQVRRIKDYYREDYEFFASRGITFPERAGV